MNVVTPHERELLERFAEYASEAIGLPRRTGPGSMRYLADRFINEIEGHVAAAMEKRTAKEAQP